MRKSKHVASFFSGVVTALLAVSCLTTALAASGTISYNFSNVSLNGERKITAGVDITASNGQKVPSSILYVDEAGGKTNYLPIRAISELLGVEIGYDSATKTVLLGGQQEQAASSGFTAAEMAGALHGDAALIQSRGGTLLPDDDPRAYLGIDGTIYKCFEDKNGVWRVEYFVGNPNALQGNEAGLLKDLSETGDYRKNSKGESYGHLNLNGYVGYTPDLIFLAEYPYENRPAGYFRDSELAAIPDLPKEQCSHQFSIPLYDSEGKVIGEYKVGCRGHYDTTGMTVDEAKEALAKGPQ